MWGAAGYGTATLISGFVYDHTGGGYESVVVVFVVALVVALVAALGVPVGTNGEPPGCQNSEGSRYVLNLSGGFCYIHTARNKNVFVCGTHTHQASPLAVAECISSWACANYC